MKTYLAVVQTITVVVAALGLYVALRIARRDREEAAKAARADRDASARVARDDRSAAREDAQHRHRIDLLVRLVENLERGGSLDHTESRRMGAEAGALIDALGPDLLPLMWAQRHDRLQEARDHHAERLSRPDDLSWHWTDDAEEAAIALHDLVRGGKGSASVT